MGTYRKALFAMAYCKPSLGGNESMHLFSFSKHGVSGDLPLILSRANRALPHRFYRSMVSMVILVAMVMLSFDSYNFV